MTKAYIYTRCATQEQVEKFQLPETINNQIHRCKKYAKEHNYCVIKEFNDIAIGGNTLLRKGLSELYNSCIENKIKYVLVENYERLAKDPITNWSLKKYFQKSGINFIIVDGSAELYYLIDQLCDE